MGAALGRERAAAAHAAGRAGRQPEARPVERTQRADTGRGPRLTGALAAAFLQGVRVWVAVRGGWPWSTRRRQTAGR